MEWTLEAIKHVFPLSTLRQCTVFVLFFSARTASSLYSNIILLLIYFSAHCLPEKIGKVNIMGVFDWQLTVIGKNSPFVECPYGLVASSATHLCGGNFSTGGIWKNPDINRCKYKSERTNKLNRIANTLGIFWSYAAKKFYLLRVLSTQTLQ